MYISDWVPPGTDDENLVDADGGGAPRLLFAVVAVLAAAALAALAGDYAHSFMTCAAQAAGDAC